MTQPFDEKEGQPSSEDAELVEELRSQALNAYNRPSAGAEKFHWDTYWRSVHLTAEWQAAARLSALSGQKVEVSEVDVLAMAKWIDYRAKPSHLDFACKECLPNGDMLIDGFRCAVHTARAILRDALKGER